MSKKEEIPTLFDADGNPVSEESLIKRILNSQRVQEIYGMNKTAAINSARGKLGQLVIKQVEDKAILPFLPEGAAAVFQSPIAGGILHLALANGLAAVSKILAEQLPAGPMREIAGTIAVSLIQGGWDSSVKAKDIEKFLTGLMNPAILELVPQAKAEQAA